MTLTILLIDNGDRKREISLFFSSFHIAYSTETQGRQYARWKSVDIFIIGLWILRYVIYSINLYISLS